jgi:hypothetical protein
VPAPPAEPAEYDGQTGAPVNATAKRHVAREWRAAVPAGALPRVVQLPFGTLNRVTDDFSESNQVTDSSSLHHTLTGGAQPGGSLPCSIARSIAH